jgi:hypothetical protein
MGSAIYTCAGGNDAVLSTSISYSGWYDEGKWYFDIGPPSAYSFGFPYASLDYVGEFLPYYARSWTDTEAAWWPFSVEVAGGPGSGPFLLNGSFLEVNFTGTVFLGEFSQILHEK